MLDNLDWIILPMMNGRITTPQLREEDEGELSLRPKRLREFIGQDRLKENLQLAIDAARGRGEPLDHILFYGPPGLGKTTLSLVCAHEMDAPIHSTSGPAIERPGDLAAILTNLEPGSVLFIDEIHRLNRPVEEILYPAMEDFQLDLVIGKGPSARTLKLELPPFTLIGATTRAGLLSSPLRDRFGMHHYVEFYTVENLTTIVRRSAEILNIEVSPDGATEIARRSRGTPRIANRLLKRCRDYAQVRAEGIVTREVADATMKMLEIDPLGLDDFDRRYLRTIIEKYDGGPVGIETLAAALGEERDTMEDVLEPYLLQLGFLNRTS
ncbi:MAG TPA: Holliday junction branch migration DNA helicase RuvB, partial [Chthonomonadales bacterium]|nr:Holliday junction branch migration DNA helicase RuvB [Chthonomonadales bacterium]